MLGIQALPIELLIHIFHCVSPTDRRDIRLSHVCKIWRDTLQNTSGFWANFLIIPDLITSNTNNHERDVRFWHLFVERTSSQPLHLRLGGWDFDLLNDIPKHLPRLTYLHVHWKMVYPKEVQRRLLALAPLPALKDLRLSCDHPAPETHFLDLEVPGPTQAALLTDKYPQLRYLEVNPDFFVPSMVVQSVIALAICDGNLSLIMLKTALAHCQTLEYLRLENVDFWDIQDASEQVVLPHLRELCLCYSHDPVMHLIPHIRCPSITRLDVSLSSPFLDVGMFNPHSLPIIRILTRLELEVYYPTDDAPALSINGYINRDVIHAPPLHIFNERFRWKHRVHEIFTPIASITEILGSSMVSELEVRLLDEDLNMTHLDWTMVFEAFPALTSLVVHISSCHGLLRALRQTPLRPAGLERLTIACGNGAGVRHTLVLTLETRASLGHRLQRLEFRNLNGAFASWHLARLQDVVEEVVIVA
ncbi:hypothetical protein L227DRAFT_219353 [Lentinus tigrinus ALCF2SS1-6]|uniref:F-box domain-containing protein n=2 Tax=Lentinus tigrinus TaxID=5365 RepID=A0A5C2SRE6_9APHY|nr:hypothetical protein L227DRAFT_219353 [Lentinus tigrinus ALCF2SS1-6]